jgi:hypothetical protein
MPLENRNHGNAVFIPTVGGNFKRFHAMSGTPMPAGPQDAHGLFDAGGGNIGFGKLPAAMALDAAIPNFRPDAPTRAAAVGAQREQQAGGSDNGAISKTDAAALVDLASKAGASEADLQALGRVLVLLTGADDDNQVPPTTGDQNRGGQKISVDKANRIAALAKDKISPADFNQLVEMLRPFVDPNMEDEDVQGQDQPPPFKGAPLRGGGITGDAALAAFQETDPTLREALASMARIKPDDNYGVQAPPSRHMREAQRARLALDERRGGSTAEETNPDLAAAIAGRSRIGRCY